MARSDGPSPTREFLYVAEAAEGIILAAERFNSSQPVNPGSSFETCSFDRLRPRTELAEVTGPEQRRRISLKDLVETIAP